VDKDEAKIKTLKILVIFLVLTIGVALGYKYKLVHTYQQTESKPVYILITVDVERDLVPYLDSYEGVTKGVPLILDILREQGIKATFFVTGNAAIKYPGTIERIAEEGHEIGGQGFMHENFSMLNYSEKFEVISKTTASLKKFNVKTFRSPYQSSDTEVIDILEKFSYCAEASYEPNAVTHIITHTTDGQFRKSVVRITSEPLFYPSTTYPDFWIDVYKESLVRQNEIIVVGLHSWEILELPEVEGAEEYVRASGNYTYINLVNLIKYLKEQIAKGENIEFLKAREVCELLLV